jgi:hypothetical protein
LRASVRSGREAGEQRAQHLLVGVSYVSVVGDERRFHVRQQFRVARLSLAAEEGDDLGPLVV